MRPALTAKAGSRGKIHVRGLPGTDGVFGEPPPHRRVADGGDEAGPLGLAHDVGGTQA